MTFHGSSIRLPLRKISPQLPRDTLTSSTITPNSHMITCNCLPCKVQTSGPLGGPHWLHYLFSLLESAQRVWNLSYYVSLFVCLFLFLAQMCLRKTWLNFLLCLRPPEDELAKTTDIVSLPPRPKRLVPLKDYVANKMLTFVNSRWWIHICLLYDCLFSLVFLKNTIIKIRKFCGTILGIIHLDRRSY